MHCCSQASPATYLDFTSNIWPCSALSSSSFFYMSVCKMIFFFSFLGYHIYISLLCLNATCKLCLCTLFMCEKCKKSYANPALDSCSLMTFSKWIKLINLTFCVVSQRDVRKNGEEKWHTFGKINLYSFIFFFLHRSHNITM